MRIGRIGRNIWSPIRPRHIVLMEETQLFPEKLFELDFGCFARAFENGDEAGVVGRALCEIRQRGGQLIGRFSATQFAECS